MTKPIWDRVAHRDDGSWYLDPLVAEQKRAKHLALIARWTRGRCWNTVLKTDLFEEANGSDHLLSGLPACGIVIGIDVAHRMVARARDRHSAPRRRFATADVRRLGLADASVDLAVSNSTLDHFSSRQELCEAIGELARVLRPGGALVVTLDNPRNPLYRPLRWLCAQRWAPFPLGYTTTLEDLAGIMNAAGLDVTARDYLIHNPRMASTALYLLLRRVLGGFADGPIGVLLRGFDLLDALPTRAYTACYSAACGKKRGASAAAELG